jgi:hypothetical protein
MLQHKPGDAFEVSGQIRIVLDKDSFELFVI